MGKARTGLKPCHRRGHVAGRQAEVLAFLKENGESKLTDISAYMGARITRVRYAMRAMRQDHQSYISRWEIVDGLDGCPRLTAFYVAGDQPDAPQPNAMPELDWDSTQHLQPIYAAWAQTRAPDYPSEDE